MTDRRRWQHFALFLAIGALSLGAGALIARPDAPLDLQCSGRAAQQVPGENQQWLLHKFDLDLRAEGQGDYKARLRLLDAASQQTLGYLNRTANFSQQRQGQRLLIQVLHSSKSTTGNLQEQRLAGLGLYIFNEQLRLSYPIRQLAPGSLLLSNGQGGVLLCVPAPAGA